MATQPSLFNDNIDLDGHAISGQLPGNPGLIQRLAAWYMAKVQAERDAEITAFIAERGGQFNDELEREISRRFGGMVN